MCQICLTDTFAFKNLLNSVHFILILNLPLQRYTILFGILAYISKIYIKFAPEKSCLTANIRILQKLGLLPNHYLYRGKTLINSSF